MGVFLPVYDSTTGKPLLQPELNGADHRFPIAGTKPVVMEFPKPTTSGAFIEIGRTPGTIVTRADATGVTIVGYPQEVSPPDDPDFHSGDLAGFICMEDASSIAGTPLKVTLSATDVETGHPYTFVRATVALCIRERASAIAPLTAASSVYAFAYGDDELFLDTYDGENNPPLVPVTEVTLGTFPRYLIRFELEYSGAHSNPETSPPPGEVSLDFSYEAT